MLDQMLTLTIDKFNFRIPTELYFSESGVWIKLEGRKARLGISDFMQQRSGDITFATLVPIGTEVRPGEEMGTIETVKANVSIISPLGGTLIDVNRRLELEAELINQDPYGEGWLAAIDLGQGEHDMTGLLQAEAYLEVIRGQAEAELML